MLSDAFNRMLDRLAAELKGQREFIADASHELRTPITVIRGQLEVLAAQENPSADDVRRAEEHVQREITRISRLVDDLLLLAQAEHTDFLRSEPIDLRPFVEQLWDGISLTADRRFELGPVPAGRLRADPDRLAQALRNLARNAIGHTREHGGLVRLEVDAAAGRTDPLHGRRRRPGHPGRRARARVRALSPHRPGRSRAERRGRPGAGDRSGDRRGARRPGPAVTERRRPSRGPRRAGPARLRARR